MIDATMAVKDSSSPFSRRSFLAGAGGLTLAAAATSMLPGCPPNTENPEVDVLNFALNLEYLEAEFYTRAVGLTLTDVGLAPGAVTGGTAVIFQDKVVADFANEVARNEMAHVTLLRGLLGVNAVDRPEINLTDGFTQAAVAAGLIAQGLTFDPFASDENFLLASFLFEDIGVTAYAGGATLLTNAATLQVAGRILGTEAYQAGALRAMLAQRGLNDAADKISDARDTVDGPGDDDQHVVDSGDVNVAPTDATGLVIARTVSQVLRIVYLNGDTGVSSGGFFPNGVNGVLRTT